MKRETGQVSSQTVRRGDDQVENVMFVVGWKVNMLSNVEAGEKREKLRGEVVSRIIEVNVKVASDELMRGASSEREEGMEVLKKNSLV